ncbi:MAG TPA: hypothetical protein VN646_23520 [Candidatus Acidoferrum sp.]|jgi:hypothetical protein|nr:hypothetical protein [Candidatus Acidoferrum sp.]
MYSLVRIMPVARLLREQVPAFLLAFVVAELFYKFHSFTLETLAFLATWGVIDAAIQVVRHLFTAPRHPAID